MVKAVVRYTTLRKLMFLGALACLLEAISIVAVADDTTVRRILVTHYEHNIDRSTADVIKDLDLGDVRRIALELASDRVRPEKVRTGALFTLAILKDEKSIDTMIEFLSNSSTRLRLGAIRALSHLGTQKALESLRNQLAKSHEEPYIYILLDSLSEHMDAQTKAAMEKFASQDSRQDVKAYCKELLER